MDEIDKAPVGKSKKQRIKNLRHVCNRILDFCDRQDADDRFYEKLTSEGQRIKSDALKLAKPRKKRLIKRKGTVKKSKSTFATNSVVARVRVSNRLPSGTDTVGPSRNPSSAIKRKGHLIKATIVKRKFIKVKRSSENKGSKVNKTDEFPKEEPPSPLNKLKEVKKKQCKKKKLKSTSKIESPQIICV